MGRESFRNQMDERTSGGRASAFVPVTDQEKMVFAGEIEKAVDDVTAGFESKMAPSDMRQLALVAHNHMKPAMKEFIQTYSEILMKFRITGTQTTMRMCKTLWGEDNPEIEYGLTCTSGPLGGDAQIAALMCMEDLGALIFFIDPLSAHPHQADIDSLGRLANCGNIIVCANPTSAMSMMHTLKAALESRFNEMMGGSQDFYGFFARNDIPDEELAAHSRILDYCLSMGSATRPSLEKGSFWYDWFGNAQNESKVLDRCRILFAINTVGAGRGPTILWETAPPTPHATGPKPWISEQETAAQHLQRNLQEIDNMCASGLIAARVQVLVCEPIPGEWTDWMDAQLVHCGGKPAPLDAISKEKPGVQVEVEDRPSPVQVVVVSSATTADTCHDLKSGFMEKRMQDIILAPPMMEDGDKTSDKRQLNYDSSVKTTHPDLISSDHHDLYVAMKWSSLVTMRSVSAFLQASADLAVAAAAPAVKESKLDPYLSSGGPKDAPKSPFLIPSFVRMSYVSEENSKVAKWRMHGDFFHPAAWEVCKDSYETTWIPNSVASSGGLKGVCPLQENKEDPCGQWWVFMSEEQMPTTPEVFANEVTAPLVQGGSNFFWMMTERQRRELVDGVVCRHVTPENEIKAKCVPDPQAVLPLGDLESFLINYLPNTALGRKHEVGRRPGYTVEEQREADREKVRERKQLKGQEDIEKALFDYTIYPAALFHKDATIKAARAVDRAMSGQDESNTAVAHVKSSYYDVTIIKPREPVSGWCQNMARRGLCALFAEYFREGDDKRCREACGMSKYWTPLEKK